MRVFFIFFLNIIFLFCISAACANDNTDDLSSSLLKGKASINKVLPKDTALKIAFNQDISSKENQLGDEITATILNDVFVNNENLLPVGSIVVGHINKIKNAGKVSMQATIGVELEKILLPNGDYIPLHGAYLGQDSKKTNIHNNLKGKGEGLTKSVGLGIVKGATLSFIPGGKKVKTAALGAAATGAVFSGGWSIGSTATIGGLTGLYLGLTRHGKEVMIASGEQLEIVIDRDQDLSPVHKTLEEVAVDSIMNKTIEEADL